MSGLVGYGSSDESEDEQPRTLSNISGKKAEVVQPRQKSEEPPQENSHQDIQTAAVATGPSDGPIAGPTARSSNDEQTGSSMSPYSAERGMIMELTMPPVPVFDIPESPPGSPDPSLERKLEQFAQLKKQGHHFNERLANSTSINNPNLFNKLMKSFGIESEQYTTTLSKDIWDPTQFPEWAFKDGLARAQAVAQKQRKDAQLESGKIDFVSPAKRGA